jgi:hypothetical protein
MPISLPGTRPRCSPTSRKASLKLYPCLMGNYQACIPQKVNRSLLFPLLSEKWSLLITASFCSSCRSTWAEVSIKETSLFCL